MIWLLLFALAQPMILDLPRGPAAARFRRMTGYPKGRPGFVVDHRIPLCAGGIDAENNLRWEAVKESYVKDYYERQLCRELQRQGFILVKASTVTR